ncbi:MAG: hypothetical protein HBSIN02_01720 [Bacteroidia bacterium]|nr:MAG: hypothetical protein HBSIN02_01720 [Bacteroidia bacterium]
MRWLAWGAVFAFLIGCGETGRQEASDQETRLARTYGELLLHREHFGRPASADSITLYRTQVDSILRTNGYTRAEFVQSFLDLIDTPDRFDPLFQSLSTELQQKTGQ